MSALVFVGAAAALKVLSSAADGLKKAMDDAAYEEGEFVAERMKEVLAAGVPPAPSALSALLGKGGPPLAGFARSVVVKRVDGAVFVGIKAGEAGKGAMSRDDLAAMHNEGRTCSTAMSDKQRRWLMAQLREKAPLVTTGGRHVGSGQGNVIRVTIPARPWLEKSIAALGGEAVIKARFLERVAKNMKGAIGFP